MIYWILVYISLALLTLSVWIQAGFVIALIPLSIGLFLIAIVGAIIKYS